MLKCKEVIQLLGSNENFSLMRRMELRFHLILCKHCSNFSKQLQVIKSRFAVLFKSKTNISKEVVQEIEQKILKEIDVTKH